MGGLFSFSSLLLGRGLSWGCTRRAIKGRRSAGTTLAWAALTGSALALATLTWAARLAAEVGVRV